MRTANDPRRAAVALMIAGLPLAACNTAELRDPGHGSWRQMCEAQITGTAACEDGTGMWRITERDQTHRWIVVRNGDDLYMERARRTGYREHDYWVSVPETSAPAEGRWQLVQPHADANDDSTLEVSFDPTFHGVQAVWHYDIRRSQASYQPYTAGNVSMTGAIIQGIASGLAGSAADTEFVRGQGILAAWPGLDGQIAGARSTVAAARSGSGPGR